ncbi:MAG: SMC-Scp complex subunit ScpB [Deferribacteres bacterium]|nr:SMC-Scp complex subunit ScpB [candidate division KSB1 bacterium]MCB9502253.1 SMC-Scp complex subunit ScpB [Deferribacteres bacterium]
MNFDEAKQIIEALIFAADNPISEKNIKSLLEDELNGISIDTIVTAINDDYINSGRSFEVVQVAGGFQIITRPEFAAYIKKMYMGRIRSKLSQAALEVLAIVSFKQPISKADVSAVRGANSDSVIKNLLERRLITISGRGEGIGRPLLYSTTPEFLEYFGINDISELPKPREIEELFKEGKYSEQIVDALAELDDSENMDNPEEGNEQTGDDAASENQAE